MIYHKKVKNTFAYVSESHREWMQQYMDPFLEGKN
jgi:hypothetical protein